MANATHKDMLQRYERLKRQYFYGTSRQVDETGEELPQLIDRSIIVRMFENMGVELPLTPDYPMTPIKTVRR